MSGGERQSEQPPDDAREAREESIEERLCHVISPEEILAEDNVLAAEPT